MKKKKSSHLFSKNKGLKLFGLGKQDVIKYFFGGNATISIIVLVLICFFLGKEALLFFPDYRQKLEIYRKSGQEYADLAEDQLKYQDRMKSLITQIKAYELYARAGYDAEIPPLFVNMQSVAAKLIKQPLDELKIANDRIAKRETVWEYMDEADVAKEKKEVFEQLKVAQQGVNAKIKEIAPLIKISDLGDEYKTIAKSVTKADPTVLTKLQDALVEYYTDFDGKDRTPKYIADTIIKGQEKRDTLEKLELFLAYSKIQGKLTSSLPEYKKFVDKLRDHSLKVKLRAESFASSAAREEALTEGLKNASEDRKEEIKTELKRIIKTDQDYDKLAETVYATLDEHESLAKNMTAMATPALATLPAKSELTNSVAKNLYDKLKEKQTGYKEFFANKRKLMVEWRHDKEYGMTKAVFGFFFGKKWVTNSSWNDFFGLLPLFGGSLWITLIAISIATPFAIGGAIYVNRLASPLEQTIIKPVIEFIQAIPSVVLAFLGVLVVGQALVKLSNMPMFDWIPGFPVSDGKMMLTAGILLAFMAIPTMFTLAEDAINNVPKSYNEASLALGATKFQTIIRVIIPCSLSGIVAAVLLGFGRIIGETMVVLLVAGGRIAWPESWTDPVHTMTGIIAQETGEAPAESLQFRALFMVGLVLFLISLTLNSLAQRVIKKYGSKN